MHKKIICQYYIISCLFNAAGLQIISAVYVTFLIKHDLSLLQVNLVNATFYLTLFICEIPTGAFADIFGRKTSFVAACVLKSAGMFVYGCSSTFSGFIFAEILGAVGATFRSGAFKAWLVDSLEHHGYTGDYTRIFGRESLINQIGGGIGAIAGSYLAMTSQSLPWFIGGSALAITAVIAMVVMKEEYFVHAAFSWKRGMAGMIRTARTSIRYGMTDRSVRFVLIATGIQIFCVQALNMYWQPFFRDHGVMEKHYGFIFTGMMAMLATGAFIASRLDSAGRERRLILNAQIAAGIIILGVISVPWVPVAAAIFVMHEIPRGCWSPLMDGYLQKRIPSSERATIASFCAIAPHIGGAIGLLVSGLIAQAFGISTAWIVSALALIVGAVFVGRNGKNH